MENESEKLICLAERLKERVIGQERAAEAVASSIRRSRTGISDPGRPIGSFIFLGPTGVGKTELTKALAEELFGSRDAIIRLDMSEYMERHSASKLVGSPPGYVGYDEGGLLTDKVRRKPYSVVLFDEIEKADPEIFNLLLQILDEGELTDAHGRKADFKNSVIVMTSNVGASYSEEGHKIGFSSIGRSDRERTESEEKMRNELKKTFRPEFLNRVDDIIMFERLGETEIKRIARKMLEEFVLRAGGCGIRLELDDSVTALVTEKGFDRQNGARPLRRAIASLCEDSFSRAVLSGELSYGDKVVMRAENDEIIFEKKKKPRRK